MSFEKGTCSFRVLYAPQELPADVVDRFAKSTAPELKDVGTEPVVGWTGGRHALDTPITEDNAKPAGYLRLILRKAERKVPTARLKAECAMVEQAKMAAEGKPFLDKKTRKEIKEQVIQRLKPLMEPTLTGLQFVYDGRERVIYVNATSDKQLDAFTANWLKTVETEVVPVNPGTAAKQRKNVEARQWLPVSFSELVDDSALENTPGPDFLTWLWYWSETAGKLTDDRLGEFAVLVEGPLLLERHGAGAHETSLRKGLPTVSDEAKTALSSGKKLCQAKLTLARGEEIWSCTFDAETFVFRSVKLPDPKEAMDATALFQNRVFNLCILKDAVLSLYDRFVDARMDDVRWFELKTKIREWVALRQGKM